MARLCPAAIVVAALPSDRWPLRDERATTPWRRGARATRTKIMRFSAENVEQWREEGFVVIERFFAREEYEPVLRDFEQLYRDAGKGEGVGMPLTLEGEAARDNRPRQFKNIHVLPYEGSSAINLISLHPDLIAFARAALGVSDVRLYQSHTWAKFTGEADYDQELHCDYGNHTLLVPSEDPARRTVAFILYLTDVTNELGALRYVTKPDVLHALGRPALSAAEEREQEALRQKERAVEVPAGSIVAHGIDTMHRGSNLTAPNGRRFSMTVGYKAAHNDQIGFHVWQASRGRGSWQTIFEHANVEQLACLGIPPPGDPFWTPRTLELTQSRWPSWDMREYFAAPRPAAR
jgi:ectoine hydroxylase-related dioxygenase (phytanoyl-CoA dioxygenase family)